jgi:DNA-directed RNA polymerase specialized sigma24 family protein
MCHERVVKRLEADKDWLSRQPKMIPWDEGCIMIRRQIEAWLATYSEPFCDRTVTPSHSDHTAYADRLWQCWSYHWQQATEAASEGAVDGWDVAERIRGGRGYRRGGQLGGDPLRDVVLAMALLCREERVVGCFRAEYLPFARNLAGKIHRLFARDPDDWWYEFIDHLAGYTRSPGKLEKFAGHSALRNWLGTVLWNFLARRPVPANNDPLDLAEIEQDGRRPIDGLASQECLGLFAQVVGRALAELANEDRTVLRLLYAEPLPLKDVATVMDKHPGNVGKQRDRALNHIRESVRRQLGAMGQQDSFEEWLRSLWESPADAAAALVAALGLSHAGIER